MSATFFWKSTCTTCRDARAVVRRLSPGIGDRNYAKDPLSAEEVSAILAAAGSVLAVMNSRHEIAKTRGWKEKPPSVADFTAAVLALLRRQLAADTRRQAG